MPFRLILSIHYFSISSGYISNDQVVVSSSYNHMAVNIFLHYVHVCKPKSCIFKIRSFGVIKSYEISSFLFFKQDAQLSQRDRAAGCVIVYAKSRRLELGDNILRTV